MATLQKITVMTALAVMTGTGIYAVKEAAGVQAQGQRQAALAAEIQGLKQARDEATNQLAMLAVRVKRPEDDEEELLKLRSAATQSLMTTNVENDPVFLKAREWMEKEGKIRQVFADHPDQAIPEMKLLKEEEWLDVARQADVDTVVGMRAALSSVRSAATADFGSKLCSALASYEANNNQQLPGSVADLKNYIHPPIADVDSMLSRYRMMTSDEQANSMSQGAVIMLGTTEDSIDAMTLIGPHMVHTSSASLWAPDFSPGK
jgi:hypothetical protein